MNLTAKEQILIVNAHVHQGKSFMLRFSLFFWWPKLEEVKFSLRLKSFTCAFSINVLKCNWGSPRPNTFPSPKGSSVEICFERERHILAASVFVGMAVCGLCFCVCMSGSWKLMAVQCLRLSHSTSFLRQGLSLSPRADQQIYTVSQDLPVSRILHPGIRGAHWCAWSFMWVLGNQTHAPKVAWNLINPATISESSNGYILWWSFFVNLF